MIRHIEVAAVVGTGLSAWPAQAAEKSVVLNVENASCALCAPIVSMSLRRVPGVSAVEVVENYAMSPPVTAKVVFDDAVTNVEELVAATTYQGYPSYPANWAAQ